MSSPMPQTVPLSDLRRQQEKILKIAREHQRASDEHHM